MSVRERAYNIFLQLTEEQLEQFVNMFGQGSSGSPTAVDRLRGILKDVQDIDLKAEREERLMRYESDH